jgi:UDP-N-acetylglucosamine--N-acetylmuramyl-(pentapeptide) pyrophosphoryl-undecaprenol N-acetylglucosamine transferase
VARGELTARPPGLEILWATGPTHVDGVRERLAPLGLGGWVHVVGYIDAMPRALASADVALSRAGAMATAELLAWGVPAVLVPLPTAAADHQTANARALAAAGAAIALAERDLSPRALSDHVRTLLSDDARLAALGVAAARRGHPHATRDAVSKILTLIPPPQALSQV